MTDLSCTRRIAAVAVVGICTTYACYAYIYKHQKQLLNIELVLVGSYALYRVDPRALSLALVAAPMAFDAPLPIWKYSFLALCVPFLPIVFTGGAAAVAVIDVVRRTSPLTSAAMAASAISVAPMCFNFRYLHLLTWVARAAESFVINGSLQAKDESRLRLRAVLQNHFQSPELPLRKRPCVYAVNYPRQWQGYTCVGVFPGNVDIIAGGSGWLRLNLPFVFCEKGDNYERFRAKLANSARQGRSLLSFNENPWSCMQDCARKSILNMAKDLDLPIVPVYVHFPSFSSVGLGGGIRVKMGADITVTDTDACAHRLRTFWMRAATQLWQP